MAAADDLKSRLASDDVVFIRTVSRDDFDLFYVWYRDAEVQRYLADPRWQPNLSKDDYRSVFLRRHFLRTGDSVTLIVCIVDDPTAVGFVNYFDIDYGSGVCDIGVVIGDPRWRGKGIGTRAITLLLRHIFHELKWSRVYCSIVPDNVASIRLFEKCGFVYERTYVDSGFTLARYVLEADRAREVGFQLS